MGCRGRLSRFVAPRWKQKRHPQSCRARGLVETVLSVPPSVSIDFEQAGWRTAGTVSSKKAGVVNGLSESLRPKRPSPLKPPRRPRLKYPLIEWV